jgi:predicted transcriptional regulator
MTLTVRLDSAIESALERHCAERGVSKSIVVQESLAAYLWGEASAHGTKIDARNSIGPVFLAFQHAGLVGTGTLGGASADKAAVRALATKRARRSKS